MLGLSLIALLQATPPAIGAVRPSDSVPASDSVTAFVNVSVIPMDRDRVLVDQTVLVQGDRITAIGSAKTVRVPANAVRIDGQGKFLLPALGDMHVHLSQDEEEAKEQLMAFLANGVTVVRNMEGSLATIDLRERVKAGKLLGPTIYTAGGQITALDSPEAAVKVVEEYKAKGYDFIKVREPSITLEVLDSFAAAAHRLKMPFGGHVPRGEAERQLERWLNAHPVSIEHLDGYWRVWVKPYTPRPFKESLEAFEAGAVLLDDSALAAAAATTKRAGVWNVPTQAAMLSCGPRAWDISPAQYQRFTELRGRIIKALRDAGAGLLVGTDVPFCGAQPGGTRPGLSIHAELQLLVAAGLTPYQALEASTRNVAVFLDKLDRSGTVEVGKRADLMLLNESPLQDIRHTMHPTGVMVGGRWLARAELRSQLRELLREDAAIVDEWM